MFVLGNCPGIYTTLREWEALQFHISNQYQVFYNIQNLAGCSVFVVSKRLAPIYGIIRLTLSRYKDWCWRKDGKYSSTRVVRLDAISESPGSSIGCPYQVFH